MSKKILVIYYTQSGQLEDILNNFTAPLIEAGNTVEKVRVYVANDYPFPWNGKAFFAVMPDCVLSVPTELKPFQLKENKYDLIILGYQAWFLSPSIPVNSILNDPAVKAVLKNTPVVTITGARNMWISAMQRIKKILKDSEAKLVGSISLFDKHHNFISFITIFYWMFKGKKGRWLGIFPKPGVSDADISKTGDYGKTVQKYLIGANFDGLQEELIQQKAIEVKYNLMFIESKASKIFAIWANIIAKKKKKTAWLVAFFKPFLSGRIKKQKQLYSGVN